MTLPHNRIPKTIWILWLQGIDQAPPLVLKCLQSWKEKNPGWEVRALDRSEVDTLIELDPILEKNRDTITPQKTSNIIRLNLLAKYGGVWVDASCFCNRPLDDWLEAAAPDGFFAFQRPGKDRPLANWFLASSPENYLTCVFNDSHNRFFMENRFDNERKRQWIDRLNRILNRNDFSTRAWFSFPILKVLKVHPYFCFHYLFARVIRLNPEARKIWDRVVKISADGPHYLQFEGLRAPLTPSARDHIDGRRVPVYKLNWRVTREQMSSGSTLDYLLNSPPAVDRV